jgi:hypothetical protein
MATNRLTQLLETAKAILAITHIEQDFIFPFRRPYKGYERSCRLSGCKHTYLGQNELKVYWDSKAIVHCVHTNKHWIHEAINLFHADQCPGYGPVREKSGCRRDCENT